MQPEPSDLYIILAEYFHNSVALKFVTFSVALNNPRVCTDQAYCFWYPTLLGSLIL